MKRPILLLTPIVLSLSIAACSSNKESSEPNKDSSISSSPIISSEIGNDPKDGPTFTEFAEVAYYSYWSNKAQKKSLMPKTRSADEMINEGEDYTDDDGRLHYPIPVQNEYTFSDFLYFSFTSQNDPFLEERIGNGVIQGLTVKTDIFDEKMIILKNGYNYYSCLISGYGGTEESYVSSKILEGFEIVKDAREKKFIYLTFPDGVASSLSDIRIDNISYAINPGSITYDNTVVRCSVNELREKFSLEPDPAFEEPGEEKRPAVQLNLLQEKDYHLEEFPNVTIKLGPRVLNEEGTLYVYPLYVNDVKVTEDRPDELYAYDINNDGYRDLVFRHYRQTSVRTALVSGFDIRHMSAMPNNLGRQYIMGFNIEEDGHLKAYAYTASTINKVIYDYADIAYSESKGIYYIWDNQYQFTDFKLDGVSLDDENKTPVEHFGVSYSLKANTDYLFRIAAPRVENPTIQELDFYRQSGLDVSVDDDVLGVNKFEYVSSENDVHTVRINFRDNVPIFTYKFVIPGWSFYVNITLGEEVIK